MGFRYRKSINLGGGFRVNFSKSGIGYSFGGKGFRYTKTAKGTDRVTLSLPGTGISWVQECSTTRTKNAAEKQNDVLPLRSIENEEAAKLTSATKQSFISSVERYFFINHALWALIFLSVVLVKTISFSNWFCVETASNIQLAIVLLPIIAKIVYQNLGKIEISYEYDESGRKKHDKIIHAIECFSDAAVLWQINDVYAHNNRRVHAGTAQSVSRTRVKITKKVPHFLRTTECCYYAKLKKEKIYLLPDMMLIVSGKQVGAVDFSDFHIHFDTTQFVEENSAPSDAKIIRTTWKYVNNDGTPDRRYKGNAQLPVCLYAVVDIKTDTGVNLQLYLSSLQKAEEVKSIIETLCNDEPTQESKCSPYESQEESQKKLFLDAVNLWPTKVRLLHSTSKTEDFFYRYDELCSYSNKLLDNEKNFFSNTGKNILTEDTRAALIAVSDATTLEDELQDFIAKSSIECRKRITGLKTKKARENNAVRWKESFVPYRARISDKLWNQIQVQYEKLLMGSENTI
nr:MAG TPA: Protein of unknown function (DUF4236) [Caudoviricetes sp.]